jgi:L-iditol 2-dehydrogenase
MQERIMKQAVMTAPGKIEFEDVPVPKPLPGQVLLRVNRIGICGSDVHAYHGKHPHVKYPLIQGHEVAAVQADRLIELPDELSLDQGALIEPVAVAVHAVGRTGSIEGKRVLVLGAGTIGNLVGQTANGLGGAAVAITDVIDSRLQLAARCGLARSVNAAAAGGSGGDVSAQVKTFFGAEGADVVFDCAGAAATIRQAVESSHKGADIIIVAVFPPDTVVNLGAVQRRELRLIGTHMYQKKDFEQGIELVRSGKIRLEPLITTHFDFEDYPKAYRYIDEKPEETMKVIVHVSS